ncbi:MAG: sigma-54-dependent Fis family transcriptional regulator, partial [Anaerolineae bacterium]|nr:sigma-54-dependent Fis family transcriptional regulator [Phycisphaerae bacterium]
MGDVTANSDALDILIVDDEVNIRKTLSVCLEADGHAVVAVSNSVDALDSIKQKSFDLAFVDLRLGAASGIDLIPQLLALSPRLSIVVITAFAAVDSAVEAMRRGAADYLPKPFTPAQVAVVTAKVAHLRSLERKIRSLQNGQGGGIAEVDLNSTSPAMQRAVGLARQVSSANDATVLIRGESGTGKGVLAEAIHRWSSRCNKPLAVVSCPSLSATLLESELFGHVKGAFTGSVRDNVGRIAASDGGTLFLDEVGDLPLPLQPKLLRFLQDRTYERVGDTKTRRADVRVVTATNVDLEEAVKAGRFREDLFYRLNVVEIRVPPLRERPDDILPLAERMLARFATTRRVVGIAPAAADAMRRHSWPGNVRELSNAIERAMIVGSGDYIE